VQVGALLSPLLDAWRTTVAVDPERPAVILGWLCARDERTVAWGFTKPWARGTGVLRALLGLAGVGDGFDIVFPVAMRLRSLRPRWRPYLVLT
jgi:hypothetical protein